MQKLVYLPLALYKNWFISHVCSPHTYLNGAVDIGEVTYLHLWRNTCETPYGSNRNECTHTPCMQVHHVYSCCLCNAVLFTCSVLYTYWQRRTVIGAKSQSGEWRTRLMHSTSERRWRHLASIHLRFFKNVCRSHVYIACENAIIVAVTHYVQTRCNYFDKNSSVHMKSLDAIHCGDTMYIHEWSINKHHTTTLWRFTMFDDDANQLIVLRSLKIRNVARARHPSAKRHCDCKRR